MTNIRKGQLDFPIVSAQNKNKLMYQAGLNGAAMYQLLLEAQSSEIQGFENWRIAETLNVCD